MTALEAAARRVLDAWAVEVEPDTAIEGTELGAAIYALSVALGPAEQVRPWSPA